jgi:hypothetical protein
MNRKAVTAFLLDVPEDSFLSYKDFGSGGVVVVGPDGGKYRFSNEQLERGALAASMTQTLASFQEEHLEVNAGAGVLPPEPAKASKSSRKPAKCPTRSTRKPAKGKQ